VSALDPTFETTRQALFRLDEQVSGLRSSRTIRLTPRAWARTDGGRLFVSGDISYPERVPFLLQGVIFTVSVNETLTLGQGWRLVVSDQPGAVPTTDELRAVLRLPYAAQIELRTLKRGDRFRPSGMGGRSRKLSDVLIDLKVPAERRSQVPLLVVNGEIVWLVAPTRDGFRSRVAHMGDQSQTVTHSLLLESTNKKGYQLLEFTYVHDSTEN
jgi:tRNA(Ile)-lysidine synthetase-like protein